jgi:hypothetical protein
MNTTIQHNTQTQPSDIRTEQEDSVSCRPKATNKAVWSGGVWQLQVWNFYFEYQYRRGACQLKGSARPLNMYSTHENRTQISLTLSAACVVSQTVGSFPLSKDPAAYQSIGVLPNAGRDERRVQCVLCDRTFV